MSSNLSRQLLQREMDLQSVSFGSHLFRERMRLAKNLYNTDLRAHFGCVNAIEFSSSGKFLASGGDDKRVLVWDIEMSIAALEQPRVLDTEHTSNIFCLGFDRQTKTIYSGGNDDLVIAHDFETGKLANVFKHDNPVYGLSVDPQSDSIIATACEDGQILVFDQRVDPADPFVVAQLRASFHAVQFHPVGGNYLVTANSKHGSAFWDIRKPHHPIIQYGYEEDPPSCMSVRFNSTGNLVLALRRRLPPILYKTQSPDPVCTFYHHNYYNSCTMKSCTFAGQDSELIVSGSDDFNLYVWRLTDIDLECTDQWIEKTQMVLYGHRSIVNQVRYNQQKCLLASSGVEKLVKLWSPFSQKGWTGSLLEEALSSENPRELFSPFNFASMSTSPHSWSHMSHDYTSRNTNEDPRMMAFFDSLIQQEIEGWETNSSTESPIDSDENHISSVNESSVDDDDNDDADDGEVERFSRRTKRQLVRKKERKRRNTTLRKIKVQRHKFVNRIAYLIATKRNTLRRLAIRGATLSNQRPSKIIKGARHTKHVACKITSKRGTNVQCRNSSSVINIPDVAVASTSAAAGFSQANIYRSHRRKYKKKRVYDTSSDEENNGELKVPRISSGNSVGKIPNNGPSTSTGITGKGPKDDIIRLRQQNISDSDDDDDTVMTPSSSLQHHSYNTSMHSSVISFHTNQNANNASTLNHSTTLPQPCFSDIATNINLLVELAEHSPHSNSRLSNTSYQNGRLHSTESSSDVNDDESLSFPLKRRKLVKRINAETDPKNVKNEKSKIDMLPSCSSNLIETTSLPHATPVKNNSNAEAYRQSAQLTQTTIHNQNNLSLLLTPDSGISTGTETPVNETRTAHNSSLADQELSPCKIARVRRNFNDNSDSD